MRTHQDIISDAGGYKALAQRMGLSPERVRFWARRGSIPPEFWRALKGAKAATLEELADAAATRAQSEAA